MSREGDERYRRAQAIVHELLDLDLGPAQREAHLTHACNDDGALRSEVDWLLAAVDEDSEGTSLKPAIDALARALLADARVEAVAPRQYRLIERLGEGGMGQVWLAERDDGTARQRVALKMLRGAGAPGERELARFLAEGRILAGLNHPNIAHLVDAGRGVDGAPFLAMEYVEGERIDRWCDAGRTTLRERIELFLKVCAAVEYAHARLVIHRDLKPANILVGANGEPKLLDFGIARLLDDAPGANATTVSRAMTIAYASPEQIEGKALGTATDVYSLGVLLYELLAGTRPFQHFESEHARTSAVLSGDVEAPSRVARRAESQRTAPVRRIPVDVDAIVLKALRREAERRYASVAEFAEDLRNYLAARPVLARRDAFGYRTRRFVWRNRWPLTAAALVGALAAGFTWRTMQAERAARVAADVSEKTTDFLVSTFALSDPTSAGRHDFSAREVLDQGRARIERELDGQPRVRARLLEALGNAYRGINEGTAGAPLLDEAARLDLDPAVADPLAAARSLRAKASGILGVRGSSDEAEQAARNALDLVVRHGNDDPALLADAYGTLAQALDAAGKGPQAMAAARRAVELREGSHGEPLSIAQSLLDVCAVTSDSGAHTEALPFCERAMSLYADAGATHTSAYRQALRQYEVVLLYNGDYANGLAVQRRRIGLTRELFGEDSTVLAMDRVLSAVTLAERGLFDEGAASLAQGLPVIERRNGIRSTQYASAQFNAGWFKYLLGEFDAAIPLLREALTIHEAAVGGKDNDRLPVLRVDLAIALIDSGQADAEARALLESVIEARRAAQPDTSELAYARLPLARWHVAHREYVQAGLLLDQVEAVGTRVEPELHARVASTRAAILRASGDSASALAQDRLACELNVRDVGADHPRAAYFCMIYARALRDAGETAEAESLERVARPILEKAYPVDSAFRRIERVPARVGER
jgi:serine/threonine-protein kinase